MVRRMSATPPTYPSSRVPFFTFPTTLGEQEQALAANPLLQRLSARRAEYAGDPHRPLYHYVNPEANLNDPNGLCFWRGRWHLFYQAYPPEDTRQHWGHAVSDDLIHWRDLPYCIYPNPEDKCFSGATLVEDDRVIAIYHGVGVGNMVAVSSDPLLLNWEKLGGGAVIPLSTPDGAPQPFRVFDPCIWNRDGVYYALSAGTRPVGPGGKPRRANFLLRSTDLVHWEYLHPFVEDDAFTLVGDDGACPYFWPIGPPGQERHLLLFFSHMSGGQYLLGDYDTARDKFVVTDGAKFNFGPALSGGVHAPSATPDGSGGLIVLFNMNPAKPTAGWNQIMTLPRRLTLQPGRAGAPIDVTPAGAVESLRGDHRRVGRTPLPANREVVLEAVHGTAIELIAELDVAGIPLVELNVLRAPQREEFTRIAFYPERGYRDRITMQGSTPGLLLLDNAYSSTAADVRPRAPEVAPLTLQPGEKLRLRVFVDRSVVEVFANDRQCVALRVYPERTDSAGVSLRAQGAPAVLESLDCWQMQSIY